MKDKEFENIPAEEFRKPMQITHYFVTTTVHPSNVGFKLDYYTLCPRCGLFIDSDYQNYCCYCGQRLKWKKIRLKNGCINTHYVYDPDTDKVWYLGTLERCKTYIAKRPNTKGLVIKKA